jgi:hypothetical protein
VILVSLQTGQAPLGSFSAALAAGPGTSAIAIKLALATAALTLLLIENFINFPCDLWISKVLKDGTSWGYLLANSS